MQRERFNRNNRPSASTTSNVLPSNEGHDTRRLVRNYIRNRCQYRRCLSYNSIKFVALLLLVALQSSSYFVTVVHQVVAAAEEEINSENETYIDEEQQYETSHSADPIEDSLFDPLSIDPSCSLTDEDDCHAPPKSTIEEEEIEKFDPTCFKGAGDDGEEEDWTEDQKHKQQQCSASGGKTTTKRDKHWGDNPKTISMRDNLRESSKDSISDSRPPIFLFPGLASTRLVAWKVKKCTGAFSSDIKVQDNVWLNINLVIRMGTTIDVNCLKQCLQLGLNQSDTDDWETGCKLRPDEGLDSIASLAPGGIGADLLVGGTNTVYSWLIQWLADNLGYDVTNMIALSYDWRLTPSVMELRDGFLGMTRKRIEAAVASSKQPGIMVAHSMGNIIFRYFIEWLRIELREEAFEGYVRRAKRKAQSLKKQQQYQQHHQKNKQKSPLKQEPKDPEGESSWTASLPGWVTSTLADVTAEVDEWYDWLTDEDEDAGIPSRTKSDENIPNGSTGKDDGNSGDDDAIDYRQTQLWELAKMEGDEKWIEWLQKHVWTYVGLSAPMLGALNPLRAVISGENMGLPINDDIAREMELTFGSTHTLNPVSTNSGFCDVRTTDEWGEEPSGDSEKHGSTLACLDDIANDIEYSSVNRDPWKNFPTLKALMRDRIDWTTGKPMIDIEIAHCNTTNKNSCESTGDRVGINAEDVEDGSIFQIFNDLWKEDGEPLIIKKEQLEDSYINSEVRNILNHTWDRPLIKHVIMAYGLDIPTEVGYTYTKKYNVEHSEDGGTVLVDRNETGIPTLKSVFWETPQGGLTKEEIEAPRGSIGEYFIKKKPKREPVEITVPEARLQHCGDGSVPYLSLSWAQTWLLHAARARRFTQDKNNISGDMKNALDHITISHRPQGESDWIEGPAPESMRILGADDKKADSDTGTSNPHGTRYKPLMKRYHNVGVSRTTGIEYTTTVIEAIGVEHKETTRNFDILAAVFTEVLDYMHDDLGLIHDQSMESSTPNTVVSEED